MRRAVFLLLAALAASGAGGASTNWRGAVHLPPGGRIVVPASAPAWPDDAWTFEVWIRAAPDLGEPQIDAGVLVIVCAADACGATVSGAAGGTVELDFGPLYPYSVYALAVQAEEVGGVVVARALVSGLVVDEGTLVGRALAPAAALRIANAGPDHAWLLPMRLWSTAEPATWLFEDPAPTDPDLVALWRRTEGGAVIDDAGGLDGILAIGAEPSAPLCWEAPDLRILTDGFESGDTSRWKAVE